MTAPRLPSLRWLPPLAVAAAVLALFAWMEGAGRVANRPEAANHDYNLLVQGFRAGQLSLKAAVPPGLAQLPDPLDPAANLPYRIPPFWLHDLSYYHGRLYLYFGVSPALLLFWPWAAATGHYLSHAAAVALLCGAIFLVGGAWLLVLGRRFFPELGTGVAASALALLGLASGLPILLQRPEFYEVAVSCGGALTLLALAGVCWAEGPARPRIWPLAAASLAYGLAVGARPSLLFGAVILLVPVLRAWQAGVPAGSSRAEPGKLFAASVLPLLMCGLGLALYNQLRFGSVLEFGQRYQMAGDRQDEAAHFSLSYLGYNLWVYFFAPLHWVRTFPFVQGIAGDGAPPGHAEVDGAFGLFTNLPVLWLAFAAPLAWRKRVAFERRTLQNLVLAAALLFLGCALPVCLFYGSCWRYEMDFLPALALLAGVGIFAVERALANRTRLRLIARLGWGALLAASVAVNFLESVSCHADTIEAVAQRQVTAGDISGGIAYHRQALRLIPTWSEAHNNLGKALMALPGHQEEAVAEYQQAIRFEPAAAEPYFNLGKAWAETPDRRLEAISLLQHSLRLDPTSIEAEVELGVTLAKLPERMNDAIAHFQRALAIDPACVNAHNDLAVAWTHLPGRLPDAVAEFEAAARLRPGDALIAKNLARARRQLGP